MADEQQANGGYLGIDPKELEGLGPTERAALYKQRQRAAGIGGAPAQGAAGNGAPSAGQVEEPQVGRASPPAAGTEARATQPAAAAEGQPAAPTPPELSPEELAKLPPAERAAYYKARQRAAGFVPPRRGVGEAPAAQAPAGPATAPKPATPAPKPAAAPKAPPKPAAPVAEPAYLSRLRQFAPDLTWEHVHGYDEVVVRREHLLRVARLAKEELGFDYLSAVTAVDYPDHILMIYHLYGFDYKARAGCLALHTKLPREAYPTVDSLTPIWPGAEFQEREVWDLMGVKFLGHPDLRRILLADDFPGHPLRKDFAFDYEYVLVRHLRSGVIGQAEPYVPPHEQLTTPSMDDGR